MSDGIERFVGGVADGRNLAVGALSRSPDEPVEVRLTADGEVWHIGHPYAGDDAGVQKSEYRWDEGEQAYMEFEVA